ncbi:hypothetical protein ASG35_03000 [Burkholderia sp. Leaf177]|uniref:helix-turn-helix transcriptional regulator n=1 Tax=Burkholderia sp. Leaf177 TaxID=1736287 RepID=UPI0006F56B07|nr:AlpA family phage regulatory protein [Burkholderia sp. Leaf177]KQR90193.1 hypothetical protein ASG35_03000 [Burkholderia sp. Leaf177]
MKTSVTRAPIEPELINMAELRVLLGNCSRNWIYDQLRRDPAFPRPLKLNAFSNAWKISEIRAYIDSLPRHNLNGLAAPDWHAAAVRSSGAA